MRLWVPSEVDEPRVLLRPVSAFVILVGVETRKPRLQPHRSWVFSFKSPLVIARAKNRLTRCNPVQPDIVTSSSLPGHDARRALSVVSGASETGERSIISGEVIEI